MKIKPNIAKTKVNLPIDPKYLVIAKSYDCNPEFSKKLLIDGGYINVFKLNSVGYNETYQVYFDQK